MKQTTHTLINDDCLHFLHARSTGQRWDTIFADPPDNIGAKYAQYNDRISESEYRNLLWRWIDSFIFRAGTVWLSFNARWSVAVGVIAESLRSGIEVKPCVQTFTFGQHNHHDLGNNHRPLWRFRHKDAPLLPDAIRVPSWRQKNGDKRADPRGRVPGDVFDFPRVVGNSKQRRKWHPTQLNEGLVERCLRLTTPPGGSVLDPFAGTGTTLRVCKRIGLSSTSIELDREYCERITREHGTQWHDPRGGS